MDFLFGRGPLGHGGRLAVPMVTPLYIGVLRKLWRVQLYCAVYKLYEFINRFLSYYYLLLLTYSSCPVAEMHLFYYVIYIKIINYKFDIICNVINIINSALMSALH